MLSIGPSIRRKSRSTAKSFTKSIRPRSMSVTSVGLMLIEIGGMPICEREERKPNLTKKSKFDTIILR